MDKRSMEKNFKTVVSATGGQLIHQGEGRGYSAVSIDSRTLEPGDLFCCISGERFDGHNFLPEVIEKGAHGVIVSATDKLPALDAGQGPFIVRVADTLRGLQDLAHHYRKQHALKVVGITGTNGKSTTKELVASVTATSFEVLKSRGNLNNHIGLPLNLLRLDNAHEVAILEMGMSARGEIARLAEIAEPDIGLITNISEAHMEHLPTVRDVQAAKGELFAALTETDCAIVNADDPLVLELAQSLRARKLTFGIHNDADVRGTDVQPGPALGYRFSLNTPGASHPVHLPFAGRFNLHNAVAAAACGVALGIAPEKIAAGLERAELMGQRLQVKDHNGMTLLDDTYNANPKSMAEALETLASLQVAGRRFFIVGDMFELGPNETTAHRILGEQVAQKRIDYLVAVGERVKTTVDAAVNTGQPKAQALLLDTHEEAAAFLKEKAKPGDALLFKGSRGAQMEKVLKAFCGDN